MLFNYIKNPHVKPGSGQARQRLIPQVEKDHELSNRFALFEAKMKLPWMDLEGDLTPLG